MVWPALIAAGASLIGGAADRNAKREANEKNRPVNQVAEWEAAGINPLFGLSSGAYIPHQAATIGDAFATAGSQFQRGLEFDHQAKLQETALAQENERLREALDRTTRTSGPTALEQTQVPLNDPTQIGATEVQTYDDAGRPIAADGTIAPRQVVPFGGGLLTLPQETSDMQVVEDGWGEAASLDESFWRYVGHDGFAAQKYDWYGNLLDYQPTFRTDPQQAQQGRNAMAFGLGATATVAVATPLAANAVANRRAINAMPENSPDQRRAKEAARRAARFGGLPHNFQRAVRGGARAWQDFQPINILN